MMERIAFIHVVLCLTCCLLCNPSSREYNEFYDSKTEEDLRRIPLIKPYEIIDTYTDYWLIHYFELDKNKPWNDRQKVDYFQVIDSVIIIECDNCVWDGENHKNVYTVIIPKHRIEKTFANEKAFNEYLMNRHIQPSRKYQPTETYLKWEGGKMLPWPKIDSFYEAK